MPTAASILIRHWLVGAIIGAGVLGALVWISHLIHLIRYRRLAVFLADLPPPARSGLDGSSAATLPEVALIFAARDEAAGVEVATRSMLAEAKLDPALRIIAVDDRSTDGTGAILDRLAAGAPALAVVHVATLPEDWLGKTHALQAGADEVPETTRWLLFTDADVVFQPGAVRRAVAFAEANQVDQLTIGPDVVTHSVGERLFLCLFGLLFSLYGPIGHLSNRQSRAHIGIGAFNLIRAEAFRAIGGFRHLSLSVDDDMRLGQTLKYAGYSMRFLLGQGAISVRWQEGTWGMIRGIEKNFFAGLNFSLGRVLLVVIGLFVVGIAPFASLIIGPIETRIVASLGVASIVVILAATQRQSRISWSYAFALPAATVLILIALFRSVSLTLGNDGINWRGHHYSLPTLKKHVKERNAWLDEVWRSTR